MQVSEAKYNDEISAKDGGFVFQAIVSHEIKWDIENGETKIDLAKINSFLHQVDIFPDMKFKEATATSTYVILSEVNILKRKFEMASEAIKKRISPEYAEQIAKYAEESQRLTELNKTYFSNTYYEATLRTNKIVLREVSSSGLNTGKPSITLKLSTGMVDTLDGKPTPSWDAISVEVKGSVDLKMGGTDENIAEIQERDRIENVSESIFRTIVPSLILDAIGESVAIDAFSNRSAQIALDANIDYEGIFDVGEKGARISTKELTGPAQEEALESNK